VLIFSTKSVWNISHSKKNWARFDNMYIGFHVNYPLFLLYFTETWFRSTYFRKILEYKISWKSVLWEPGCSIGTDSRTDGQTGRRDEANSRFSQFCECAQKWIHITHFLLIGVCFVYLLISEAVSFSSAPNNASLIFHGNFPSLHSSTISHIPLSLSFRFICPTVMKWYPAVRVYNILKEGEN